MSDILRDLCDGVVDKLRAHPDFWTPPAVPVFNLWRADHASRLTAAARGFHVLGAVLTTRFGAEDSGDAGVISPLGVRLLLAENLELNTTGRSVDQLAMSAAALLTGALAEGAALPFTLAGVSPVTPLDFPVPLPDNALIMLAAVDWTTAWRLPDPPDETPAPEIEEADGLLTITAAEGAEVFLSFDGEPPTREGQRYDGPLPAPPAGVTMRARAWRTGESASPIVSWSAP